MYQPIPRIRKVVPATDVLSPGEPWEGLRRVIVVRNDPLAPLVLTLPAIHAIRRAYPDSWLGLLVAPSLAGFAETFTDVDEVLPAPRGVPETAKLFQRFRADLVVCVSGEPKAPWAAWKAGIPHRVGSGYRLYSPVFHRRVDEHPLAGDRHEVEYALSFAHRSGASPEPPRFPLSVPERTAECVRNWIDLHGVSGPFVVLHPGGDGFCPSWPAEHFMQLATLLEAEGVRVVFSLGSGENGVTRALDEQHPRIRRLPRFTGDPASLAGILEASAAVAGDSNGAIHLAAAVGAPTLSLHPPWPLCCAARWGPYSERGWALDADLPEARGWSRRKRQNEGERLMAGIDPSVVLRCVRAMLEGREPEA